MNLFFNSFRKSRQWLSHLLKAYFIILFVPLQNNPSYSKWWYNSFDGFSYSAIGLRYDYVSKVYTDLF